MPEELTNGPFDGAIAGVAARQHGVVSVRQLRDLGLSSSAIGDRVTAGRLHRIHRGVCAVGHPNIGNEGRWMAAVLACGDGAALSHISAAHLWRMLTIGGSAGADELPVHVTVPGEGRDRSRIRVHRSRTLSPADVTFRDGIPVTKPARTLDDLRRTVPTSVFANALRQAEYLRLPTGDQWRSDRTRSELEAKFLALIHRHHLPRPEVNVRVDRFVVDFLWRAEHLIAELDGWEAHRSRSAFEGDRARDNRLRMLGYDVTRFTWHQVTQASEEVAATIRSLLTALW
jgi:very-short-patch-repair endonuclease